MDITLQGNLQHFRLPELLPFVGENGKTGSLKLVSAGKETQIYFDGGSIVFADATAAEGREGEAILYDSFAWEQGTFAFLHSVAVPANAARFSLAPRAAVEEGMRRLEAARKAKEKEKELEAARKAKEKEKEKEKKGPDLSVVFKVADDPASKGKIELDADQWKLLFRMNGLKPLSQVVEEVGGSLEKTLAMVQALYENRLIEKVQPGAVKEPAKTVPTTTDPVSRIEVPPPPPRPKEPAPPPPAPVEAARPETAAKPEPELEDPSTMMAALTMEGADKQTFPLMEDQHTIGRDPKNDIHLNDASISSAHARIVRSPEGFAIEDLKSRNGTFVNDARVVERQVLKENDSLRLGRVYLTYNIASQMKVTGATLYQVPRPS